MKRSWQDLVQFILGAWIFVSPFALGFITLGQGPAGTAILIGSFVIGFSIVGLSMPDYWEEIVSLLLGLALVISPWVVGYSAAAIATTNAVASGGLLMVLAVLALMREREIDKHAGANR